MRCPSCAREFPVGAEPPRFCPQCGRPLPGATQYAPTQIASPAAPPAAPVAPPPPPPERVGVYRLLGPLGQGGMGSVYDAEEIGSGRRVALKLVSPALLSSQVARDRFRQEGRVASRIAHPRCVFVLAADLDGDQPYIAMERMPGETLQDRVTRAGPLPVETAVALALDVIEGLREAHRLQVIHRDVKPSNCYLDATGRAKVGDFGLARPIAGDAGLTGTGTFVGTPLYASPEQLRGESLDPRTDVYSVTATLFFLLAGRPPFGGGDLGVVIGNILGGPPTDLSEVRPEVPPALARVLARGLERDRERRCRSLDDLRHALLPFVPTQAAPGALGLRLGAWVIDFLFLVSLTLLLNRELLENLTGLPLTTTLTWVAWSVDALVWLLYFAVLEGTWGASLGKWLLGLRVCDLTGLAAPGLARGLARTLVYFGLVELPQRLLEKLAPGIDPNLVWTFAAMGSVALGVALLTSTMRLRNGYRGVHDLLTGTRVVQPASRDEAEAARSEVRVDEVVLPRTDDVPDRMGPFLVTGVVAGAPCARTLAAEDPSLGRVVRIVIRPRAEGRVSEARRGIDRPARTRWVSGGEIGEETWEAFVAPEGVPLPSWAQARGRMEWADARPVLAQLAEECALARADGTLPRDLSVERVRVTPEGRVQIEDDGLSEPEASSEVSADRSLALLRAAASWMLEGRPAPPRPTGAQVACLSCGEPFEPIRPREEGLLREANCPACGQWRPLPTTGGQRIAMWFVLLTIGVPLLALGIHKGRPVSLVLTWVTLGTAWHLAKDLRVRLRHEDAGRAVRAPIPPHASTLLEKACGQGTATERLEGLLADLASAEGRRARVRAPARVAQTLVLMALLCIPCCTMVGGSHMAMLIEMERLDEEVEMCEAATVAIADESFVRDIVSASHPFAAAGPPTEAMFRRVIARDRERQAWGRRSLGLTGSLLATTMGEEWALLLPHDVEREFEVVHGEHPQVRVRRRERNARVTDGMTIGPTGFHAARFAATADLRPAAIVLLAPSFIVVLGVLLLLVLWPLAIGGSLSFRMAGLALVRRSGAPAIRLQWALRSLLLWGPFALLLYAAAIADFDYPSASPTIRACALALLPLYAVLALRYPHRGPHDVLLGTWVVRR